MEPEDVEPFIADGLTGIFSVPGRVSVGGLLSLAITYGLWSVFKEKTCAPLGSTSIEVCQTTLFGTSDPEVMAAIGAGVLLVIASVIWVGLSIWVDYKKAQSAKR